MDKGSVCVKPEFGEGCDRGKRKTVYVYSSWRLYTSEDFGETWSPKQEMNQLPSVLPVDGNYYPEEDRRKDRNLVCGVSSVSDRSAGKIFVGLVQDDGKLNWKYNYSVNGS